MQFDEKYVKKFECNDLTPYVDSMLFDSGEVIAYMNYEDDDVIIDIDLKVCGEVDVRYKGDRYRTPCEFPKGLRERIKNNPNWWDTYAPSGEENDDTDGDIYINMNNWFEYIYYLKYKENGDSYSDGMMCEWDISEGTETDIKDDMIELINYLK